MIFYLDASAWVKYFVREESSLWMEEFWQKNPACACSVIGPIEVMAAIRRRLPQRKTQLDPVFDQICQQFQGFQAIPVSLDILQISRSLMRRHALRGADCVHLSSMVYLQRLVDEQISLVACDAELNAAATAEQIAVIDPTKL